MCFSISIEDLLLKYSCLNSCKNPNVRYFYTNEDGRFIFTTAKASCIYSETIQNYAKQNYAKCRKNAMKKHI